MKRRGVSAERLGALLRGAYQARENQQIPDGWQAGLMARVRGLGALEKKPYFLPAFRKLVWRLAPISLAMGIGMVFLLARLYATAHYDAVELFARCVEELTLTQVLGG